MPGQPLDQQRLQDIVSVIRPAAGSQFPIMHPELFCFAILTDGRGEHEFNVRLWHGVGPAAELVRESRTGTMDCGDDPLALIGLPIRLNGLVFPEPGQYDLVLVCDGADLATLYFEVRA